MTSLWIGLAIILYRVGGLVHVDGSHIDYAFNVLEYLNKFSLVVHNIYIADLQTLIVAPINSKQNAIFPMFFLSFLNTSKSQTFLLNSIYLCFSVKARILSSKVSALKPYTQILQLDTHARILSLSLTHSETIFEAVFDWLYIISHHKWSIRFQISCYGCYLPTGAQVAYDNEYLSKRQRRK